MDAKRGVVTWIDILDADEPDRCTVVYRRRGEVKGAKSCVNQKKQEETEDPEEVEDDDRPAERKSHRHSWIGRSLSSRGRKSITFALEKASKSGRKGRDLTKKPRGRFLNKRVEAPPTDFVKKTKSYFQEVDSFELDEEDSPSPKWNQSLEGVKDPFPLQNLLTSLGVVWEDSRGGTFPQTPKDGSDLLTIILQTPSGASQSSLSSDILISSDGVSFHQVNSPKHMPPKEHADKQDLAITCPGPDKVTSSDEVTSPGEVSAETIHSADVLEDNGEHDSSSIADSISEAFESIQINDVHGFEKTECATIQEEEDLDDEIVGESVAAEPLSPSISEEDEDDELEAFDKLLKICQQTRPWRLLEALSEFCDANSLVKIGEGTFGEAFKGGGNVFKIVPIDGDFLVNGEVQKTSADLFAEVLLSITLNSLRGSQDRTASKNNCMNFIETKAIRVCQGTYDACLVNAWEDWDEKHTSENDHPMSFPEKQLYVVFILADGGKDLESFVLSDFDEARSLLIQVTASLAVAEAACEFEHRDLHWGNILLSRNKTELAEFVLQGKQMQAQTFGLSISIIDFTLSRISTGNQVLFLDLSADPALFNGPKRDTQAETYRRMLSVTQGNWEGRYPKTNSLWLHYAADTLLTKKAIRYSAKDKRALQAFSKRLLLYDSAEAALADSFFDGMWADT